MVVHKLTSIDVSKFIIDNVKNKQFKFKNCSKLTQIDVYNFKIDNVQYMNNICFLVINN